MSATIVTGSRPSAVGLPPRSPGLYRLIVSWQHPTQRGIYPVGVLSFDGASYEYAYLENVRDVPDFRPLLGLEDIDTRYRSSQLFPVFAQRVMDLRRPDYSRYVTSLGLDPTSTTPWEQISRSGGRRQGDTLQLFPEPLVHAGQVSCTFLVHGIRHIPGAERVLDGRQTVVSADEVEATLTRLRPGDHLTLLHEPDNAYNREALVAADEGRVPLGYVPNLLVRDIHRLRSITDVRVTVVQTNRADAPSHLRLIARLDADDAGDFTFFQEPYWRLLA